MKQSKIYHMNNYLIKQNIHSLDLFRCNVCFLTQQHSNHLQLCCQICFTSVHYVCYIQPSNQIIDHFWKCDRCLPLNQMTFSQQLTSSVACKFCPHKWGALKKVSHSGNVFWAHVSCIKYNPNMYIIGKKLLRNKAQTVLQLKVIDIEMFQREAFSICDYCKNKVGYAIKCESLGCKNKFHFMCRIMCSNFQKQFNRIQSVKELCKIYCDEHLELNIFKLKSSLYNNQQQNSNVNLTINTQEESINSE